MTLTSSSQYDGTGLTVSTTPPSASLRAQTNYFYDDQGRLYRTQQQSVDPNTGNIGGSLYTNYYYDYRGDLVGESDPGGLWTKYQFDGADRLVAQFTTDGAEDAGGLVWNADHSLDLSRDHVLTETLTTLDGDGNVTLVTTKDRFDTDSSLYNTDVGPLGDTTTGPLARVSYTAYYYDGANRLTASVDVGTNGGGGYTRPSSPPASSDTALVTTYGYDVLGNPGDGLSPYLTAVTDPRGIVTQYTNNMLGEVEDVTQGVGYSSTSRTDYAYDGNGDVVRVQAWDSASEITETTKYSYGVTTTTGTAINWNKKDMQCALDVGSVCR